MAMEPERSSHQAVVIQALVGALADSSLAVRESATLSLLKDAQRDALEVIDCCVASLKTVKKRGGQVAGHRASVLNVMARTVRAMERDELSEDFVRRMMAIALTEMASSKDMDSEWQEAASSLLVSVCTQSPKLVMEEIFHQLTGNTVPVLSLVVSLAEFSATDASQFVPYMKGVLSRVLPLLGNTKEAQKKTFADAFASWCEAMIIFSEEHTSAPYLGPDMQALLHSAFDLFLGRWISSRDHKVCLATVEALAQMLPLINKAQLKAAIPRLLPAILAVYKKEKINRFPVTYGVHMLLQAALPSGNRKALMLEFQAVIPILNALLPMASIYSAHERLAEPEAVLKNFNEVVRCFLLVGSSYPEELFSYALSRLSAKEIQARLGIVLILKQLLPRLSDVWTSKSSSFVEVVKPLLQEQDLNLRKAIAELIVTMGSIAYLQADTGKPFIDFLIKQSSIAEEEVLVFQQQQQALEKAMGTENIQWQANAIHLKMGIVSPSELRAVCDKCLFLLSSTTPQVQPLFWPYLLKVLMPACFTEAVATVCKCISEILKRHTANGEPVAIDYEVHRDVPRPEEILARLAILLQNPTGRNHLAARILTCLFYLAPLFPTPLQLLWEDEIPKLRAYITGPEEGDTWQQETWEEMILHLLVESVDVIRSSDWTVSFANALSKNYSLYSGDHKHTALLHRCLGVVLAKVDNRNYVREKIAVMYQQADTTNATNRLGLAMGMGLVAASHVDTVLEKLKLVLEKESKGSISRFIVSFFDRRARDVDNVFAALALMYGYAASYAPSTVIEARIDKLVGTNVLSGLLNVKTADAKQAVITAINLLGQAVIKAAANGVPFPLKRRDTMLDYVMALMVTQGSSSILGFSSSLEADSLYTQKLAINACTTLVSVEPKLTSTARDRILQATLGFYTLPTEPAPLVDSLLSDLTNLLCVILRTSGEDGKSRADQVNHLLNSLDKYISSTVQNQRERSAVTVVAILSEFRTFSTAGAGAALLPSRDSLKLGRRVMVYLPRCADVSTLIRKTSAQILDLLFSISLMLPKVGETSSENRQASYAALSSLQELIATSKWESLAELAGTLQIVESVSVLLTDQEYVAALQCCNTAICDVIPQCGEGATAAVRQLILQRGASIQANDVPRITHSLFLAASTVEFSRRQKVLEAVCCLAQKSQARLVMTELLTAAAKEAQNKEITRQKGAWPIDEAFNAFANHVDLALPFLDYLAFVLDQGPVLKDENEESTVLQPAHTINYFSLAAIRALAAIFRFGGDPMRKALEQRYSTVFSTLLLQLGGSQAAASIDTHASRDIILAFQSFCKFAGDLDMQNVLESSMNDLLTEEHWIDAIGRVAHCISLTHPKEVAAICSLLWPALKRQYVFQRITAAAALSEYVKTSKGADELLGQLVGVLSGHIGDESPVVRRLCVKGLVQVPQQPMSQYAPQVLSVVVSLIDDPAEEVSYAAVQGLPTVLAIATEDTVVPILLNVIVRLRSLQSSDSARIRAGSFHAFEKLSSFGTGSQRDAFMEQVHAILPRLILHMNDDTALVRVACKSTFKTIAPLMHAQDLKSLQKIDGCESDLRWDYEGFLKDVSQHLVNKFPDRMDTYVSAAIQAFDSQYPRLQSNAISFVACLLSQLDDQRSSSIYVPQVVSLLLSVLANSPAPSVRSKSALALGVLLNKIRSSPSFSG